MLSVSSRTLWGMTAAGEIKCFRIGRRVLYRIADLEAFAAGRVTGGAA
jgi:hypothetical protein